MQVDQKYQCRYYMQPKQYVQPNKLRLTIITNTNFSKTSEVYNKLNDLRIIQIILGYDVIIIGHSISIISIQNMVKLILQLTKLNSVGIH